MFNRRMMILGAGALTAAALAAPAARASGGVLNVVATTGMVADAARQVGGELVELRTLMGAGVDPHSYRQTRTDIAAMTRADLVLRHGLYLEAQMEEFFADFARRRPLAVVGEAVPRDLLRAHDEYENKFDPHVWMVPELWAHVVRAVRDAMSEQAPQMADSFAANAERHLEEIARLGDYARGVLSGVPEEARVLVTAHDAFGYFGVAYGFEVQGIQGISTESEAGLNRIRQLVDLLVERRVGAVFVESSVSDRNIRALVEGAAARGHEVRIGGELFSDAMGAPGTYEGTYVGMIDHNATLIAGALGADVPPRGMNGRLSAGI